MTTLLLAEFDPALIVWLVVAAISVVGGIFGKKKGDAPEAPSETPRSSGPQRPARPPTPARPTERVERRPPTAPAPPRIRPTARPAPPPPREPARTPVPARPQRPVRPVVVREPTPEHQLGELQSSPPVRAPGRIATPAIQAAARSRQARRRSSRAIVRRLLVDRASLRAALVMNELLSPPLALRKRDE